MFCQKMQSSRVNDSVTNRVRSTKFMRNKREKKERNSQTGDGVLNEEDERNGWQYVIPSKSKTKNLFAKCSDTLNTLWHRSIEFRLLFFFLFRSTYFALLNHWECVRAFKWHPIAGLIGYLLVQYIRTSYTLTHHLIHRTFQQCALLTFWSFDVSSRFHFLIQ